MRIDKPCPDGSAIRATDGSLHCSLCKSEVIDLREVTERRARALVDMARAETGRVCVRMFTDVRGRPSFLLDPVRPPSRLPVVGVALVASLAGACDTGASAGEASTTTLPVDAPAAACTRNQDIPPSVTTSGHETPPTQPAPSEAPTGTTAQPQTNHPRTIPADFMLNGGLGSRR